MFEIEHVVRQLGKCASKRATPCGFAAASTCYQEGRVDFNLHIVEHVEAGVSPPGTRGAR